MLFSNILIKLKSQIKSLGFYENSTDLPTREECHFVESKVFEELNKEAYSYWDNIFVTSKHYFLMDKYILDSLKSSSLKWLLRFILIRLLRLIWLFADLIKIIMCRHHTYYCSTRSTGNINSNQVIFIYSNNVKRGDVLNNDQEFLQHDLLVSKDIQPDYNILCSSKINLKTKAECLKIKIKYPYCNSDLIIDTFIGKTLLQKALRILAKKTNQNSAFSREGWTPISRIFLAAAREEQISSVIFYTRPIMHEFMYVPHKISTLLMPSKKSSPKYPFNAFERFLGDLPFLPWRRIAKTQYKNNTIGLLMGDEFNRYDDQRYHDRKILDVLSGIEGITCIGRPHPQEMTRPHRAAYYHDLSKEYPFLKIETMKPEDFLSDICMLITYAKSSMIQESILCKRPVIECVETSTFSPNELVIKKANGLASTCCLPNELEKLIVNNLLEDDKKLLLSWNLFISKLGFNTDKDDNHKDAFLKCFD